MKDNIDIFETSLAKLEYQDWLLSLDDNKTVDLTVSFLGANHASLMLNAGKTLLFILKTIKILPRNIVKGNPRVGR